jgi:hypothetical protein
MYHTQDPSHEAQKTTTRRTVTTTNKLPSHEQLPRGGRSHERKAFKDGLNVSYS